MNVVPNENDDTFAGTFQIPVALPPSDNTPEQAADLIKEVTRARRAPVPEPEPAPEPLPEIELIEE